MILSPSVVFGSERVATVWPEIYPLFMEHWHEIAHYKDIPLDPDVELYHRMDSMGMMRVFTAREEGKLVGYSVYFVRSNPHYKSSIQANQDVLFIQKDKRGFGRDFIKWCDEQLKNEGVQIVHHHVKKAHDFGPMLKRMGYELVDLIYARRLI